MLSNDVVENRRGPPGVNSRSLSSAHSAADLEILREIENVYFSSPVDFDAARYVLEHAPAPPTCESIEHMFTKLKRQQQVVSGKALHLISQQRDNCDKEFAEIQNIRTQLSLTLQTCRKAREHLRTASNHLTMSTFVILANFRKRQIIRSVLKCLELIRSLRSVESDVTELLNKKDFYSAIELILKSRKAAAAHKEYACITDLSNRLQDTLVLTEEKLDSVLSSLCFKFDKDVFTKLRRAYGLLGKTQAAMEQLHMHYSSAVNESSVAALKKYTGEASIDTKFQNLCASVPSGKAPACVLDLCENLFYIMRSYYLLVDWHSKHDEEPACTNVFDIQKNVSREYIRQKLKAGLLRIWHDVQGKVSIFLKSSGLEDYPFEKFVQILGVLRKLTQIGEVFCGDKSDVLEDFIKTQSVVYIQNYHRGRLEELKLFLENEAWEQCPVKSTFNLLNLQEFKQFKKYLNRSDGVVTKNQSENASSVTSQDDSVYVTKYFKYDTSSSPFDMFRNENTTNDDIFGLEPDMPSDDSEDEPDELKRDFVEENDRHEYATTGNNEALSPSKVRHSVIVANTTLSVLRNCGQYLQICRYLPQTALEVVVLMNQLYDYYFYTVHTFFTSDLDVSSTTLYTTKLTALLKRITNSLENGGSENRHYAGPEQPHHLDLSSESNLHGLSERIVAVESVIFLAKQYEMLQPYLETMVAPHQRLILEHFRDNTLAVVADLRTPVYMCSASKSVDARTALVAMSQVKWDVKNVAVEHSPYVDMVVRKLQVYALRIENISNRVTLNREVLNSIWTVVSKYVIHLLVEGFSNATKCSNGGRGLMQLDYTQLLLKLEKISGLKPVPHQDYVDRYVKAYYLPRKGLEEFVVEHPEYSTKHLVALVSCACENKKDRQAMISLIEEKEIPN